MKVTPEIERSLPEVDVRGTPSQTHPAISPALKYTWTRALLQFFRFSLVGALNTLVDVLILNALLWLFPTQQSLLLIIYNSIAYGLGAINSFVLNRYWTFDHRQKITFVELARFVMVTCAGIVVNDLLIWSIGNALHPFISNATIWTNTAKILAISGTSSISYLGMRLWVFVKKVERHEDMQYKIAQAIPDKRGILFEDRKIPEENLNNIQTPGARIEHSLSVVLPAYNEQHIIVHTVSAILNTLSGWMADIEVIVVNDGSTDQTEALVTALAHTSPQVRLVTHEVNRGYGAALVSGFAAATKELTFFMDSDGQFDIRDLRGFLPYIDEYEAVIGYRVDRQDSWARKVNAWGWNCLIKLVLGVHVHDIDCAFKLMHTKFLHAHPLETRSAMINAELLYRLTRSGCTYKEIGVQHLSRQGGRASGANLRVILRAFRDLFLYSSRWKREEQQMKSTLLMKDTIKAESRTKRP